MTSQLITLYVTGSLGGCQIIRTDKKTFKSTESWNRHLIMPKRLILDCLPRKTRYPRFLYEFILVKTLPRMLVTFNEASEAPKLQCIK